LVSLNNFHHPPCLDTQVLRFVPIATHAVNRSIGNGLKRALSAFRTVGFSFPVQSKIVPWFSPLILVMSLSKFPFLDCEFDVTSHAFLPALANPTTRQRDKHSEPPLLLNKTCNSDLERFVLSELNQWRILVEDARRTSGHEASGGQSGLDRPTGLHICSPGRRCAVSPRRSAPGCLCVSPLGYTSSTQASHRRFDDNEL